MARKPGGKKARLSVVGSEGEHPADHNSKNALNDDEMHALTMQHKRRYEDALAAKKKAAAAFLNVTKLAKAELGDTAIDDIKDLIRFDEDGAEEKLQAEIERRLRVARWSGMSLGEQGDLFNAPKMPIAEKAFADGKRAGLAGEILKPPHGAGTEAYSKYVEGWHEGAAVKSVMAKEQTDGESILMRRVESEPDGPDAFDQAAEGAGAAAPDAVDAEGSEWPDQAQVAARKEAEPAI